jgi:hypothetical protein
MIHRGVFKFMPTKDKIAQKMFAKSIMVAVQMLVFPVRIEPHFANVLAERLRSIMVPNVLILTRRQGRFYFIFSYLFFTYLLFF